MARLIDKLQGYDHSLYKSESFMATVVETISIYTIFTASTTNKTDNPINRV
jgi:hypothetical protein